MKLQKTLSYIFPLMLILTLLLSSCSLFNSSTPVDDSPTRTAIAATAFALAWTQAAAAAPVATEPLQPLAVTDVAPTSQPQQTVALKNYAWKIEVLDEKGAVGLLTDLVMDQNDSPHIVYLDDERDNLKYTTFKDGTWHNQSFDSPNVDGYFASVAVDSGGTPHVSRYILGVQWIAYTYFTGTEWPPVDFIKDVDIASTSLALDKNGEPLIAYFNKTTSELLFASHLATGGWNTVMIDKASEAGKTFPLVLGANDQPHFCYYNEGAGLKYATIVNGSLATQVVDPGYNVGHYPSMVLDASGNPYIGYYDENNKTLKVAVLKAGAWDIQVVDSGSVGKYNSIAVDNATGLIHISYWDETNTALKHALGSGSQWQLSFVDSGKVGEYSSLGLDKAGNPHISYYDKANKRLKYASGIPQ